MTEHELGFENPFKPELHLVNQAHIEIVSSEKDVENDFLQNMLERLMAEQPALADRMKRWIAVTARDPIEVGRMVETFAVTYRLLEVANGSEPDSLTYSNRQE